MATSASLESSTDLGVLFQTSYYIGINLEDILYGIELFLYFKTMRILLTAGKARKKSNTFYAVFSSAMLFLVTIWIASQALYGQKTWILGASYPGGPAQYYKDKIFVWYLDWGTTAVVLLQLMTDGLMIYRCWIIWNFSYRVVTIPISLWVACLALGAIVDWVTSAPGADYFDGTASMLIFIYYIVAVVLNTILSCMICYRIVRHGRKVQVYLGYEYASLYFSIVTLFVESVFPYTISGIAFLVSLGIGSPTSIAFISVYFLMMCISPQILILRVVMGRAMCDQTFRRSPSTVKFTPESSVETMTRPFDSDVTTVHLRTLPNVYLGDGKV